MNHGKQTCKILKEIRKQIAEKNDITFVTKECRHKGDCAGTCPACEAEVRYLEQELRKRQQLGKTAIVAGLSVGLMSALPSGLSAQVNSGCKPVAPQTEQQSQIHLYSMKPGWSLPAAMTPLPDSWETTLRSNNT